MNNLQCAVAVLATHREARQWTDEAVAADMLHQLGLDATGNATHARPVADPSLISEDEVHMHEAAAKVAAEKATEARARLNAQAVDEAKLKADAAAAEHARAAAVARPGTSQSVAQLDASNLQRAVDVQRQVPPVPEGAQQTAEQRAANVVADAERVRAERELAQSQQPAPHIGPPVGAVVPPPAAPPARPPNPLPAAPMSPPVMPQAEPPVVHG